MAYPYHSSPSYPRLAAISTSIQSPQDVEDPPYTRNSKSKSQSLSSRARIYVIIFVVVFVVIWLVTPIKRQQEKQRDKIPFSTVEVEEYTHTLASHRLAVH
jgi:cytoskeletal protein RodZ